ncbi:MAG: cell division protein ZapA [Treponema sp.]|nr:cell division protein ZapA [Treponema sp.]MBQ6567290.1 cell division protein ZapA [Treponema sp.]MBQ7168243.1 cell division protein ZapA [Treponema sp.]
MGKLQIDILGTSFAVQAPEDDTYLKKLFSYYSEIINTIQRTSKIKDNLEISIMAGITLVDELYKEKQRNASYSKALNNSNDAEADRLTAEMIQKIDKALADAD